MLKNFLLLVKNSSWYLAGNFFLTFLGVILLPLYTRFLTPTEYGIIAIAASITALLSAFYQLGLIGAYSRFYFEYKDDQKELKRYISTIIWFIGLFGLVFTLLLAIFGRPIQALTPGVPFSPYIQLAICSSYFALFLQFRLVLYQSQQKAKLYTVLFVTSSIVQVLLTIYLVVLQKQGALGYIKAGLISQVVSASVSLWLLRHYLAPVIDGVKLRLSLRYGLPLLPHALAAWMFSQSDRMILNGLVSTAEAGLYSIGYVIGSAMSMVAASVNFAWAPLLFSSMKDRGDAAKGEIARFATYWVLVMCFVFLLISIFSREIITVFAAPQYHEAYRVVPLIALGFLFGGFYYIVANPLFWAGKTAVIAACTITAGLLNVGLNFLLIPKLQMMGAATAAALSSLYCFGAVAYFSLRSLPFPYEYKRLLKVLAITAACYLLSLPIINLNGFWLPFAVKLVLIIVLFPLFIVLVRFLDEQEKRAARDFVGAGAQWCYGKIFLSKRNKSL